MKTTRTCPSKLRLLSRSLSSGWGTFHVEILHKVWFEGSQEQILRKKGLEAYNVVCYPLML